jgi:ketosteroid isomerase-like protein
MKPTLPLLVAFILFPLAAPVAAQDHAAPAVDSAAVADVVADFHRALSEGDGARVLGLLSPDARILEGGGIETVEEYAAHHLPADMAFASAVPRQRGPLEVTVRGDVAWAWSTSRATGTYREREIDSRGAELVVLTREGEGWKIEAIHWSSR